MCRSHEIGRTSFITPPQTRIRKAENPQTRKRKAAEAIEDSSIKKQRTAATVRTPLPSASLDTPPLTTMDSDDEFMSGLSSQEEEEEEEEFGGTEESDDGSLVDGTQPPGSVGVSNRCLSTDLILWS